jgi:hypothetical protein
MKRNLFLILFLALTLGMFTALWADITVTLGEDTTSNGTSGHPTPYGTYYKNHRQQYLVFADELTALGGGAGNINAIAFNVAAVNNCSAMPNFRIRMKHTSQTELTDNFETGTYDQVWHDANFLPVAGWNTHTFTTGFDWDGSSNVLVDVVFSIIPGSYTQNASVYYTTTTGTNTALRYQSDSVEADTATSSSYGGLTANRANMQITMQPLTADYDDDMAATAIAGSAVAYSGTPEDYTITVRNNGDNTQNSYTVELWMVGGAAALDSELVTVSLDFTEQTDVVLSWTPGALDEGLVSLYGKVILTGDEDATNDETDPLEVLVVGPPLDGTYVIDWEGGGDFLSFSQAVGYMELAGIDGPVVFEVTAGVYEEQIVIPAITGASAVNTITFEPQTVRTDAILRFAPSVSADRHVVRLTGGSHIRFNDLTIEAEAGATYGWPIHIMSDSQDIEITNCDIITTATSSSSNYNGIIISNSTTSYITGVTGVSDILIENNTITGGYVGIGARGSGSADTVEGLQVLNNTLNDIYYYGIYAYYVTAPQVTGNTIDIRSEGTTTTFGAGVYFYYIYDNFVCTYNNINNPGQYGFYGNYLYGSIVDTSLLYNNSIGGGFRNTGTACSGIYLANSANIGIYFNSINMDGATGRAFNSVTTGVGTTGLDIRNNSFVFSGSGNGHASYVASASSVDSHDFNNYFSGESTNFVYYGVACADMGELIAASSDDANSVNDNPYYNSATNLLPYGPILAAAGTPITNIDDDIEGVTRDEFDPCIGAYEFEPSSDPVFVITPDEFDFGVTHILLESDPQEFVIQNQGLGTLTISSISITGTDAGHFDLVDENVYDLEIPFGETASVEVIFAPTIEGVKNAFLTIVDNITRTTHNIPLTGEGEDWTIYSIPWTEGFETGHVNNEPISEWFQQGLAGTLEWTANDTETSYNREPRTGAWNAYIRYSNTRWMFKPVYLEDETSYYFEMYARQDGATATNASITVSLGDNPDDAAMTLEIIPETGIINEDYQHLSGSFYVETGGVYFLGILGYISGSPWYISIDDIYLEERGTLEGYVTEAVIRTPINEALIEVEGTSYSALTDALGFYRIPGMEADLYNVTASKPGYEPETEEDVEIVVGATTLQDFELTAMTRVTVNGFVNANDSPFGLGGTDIYLTGVENYELLAAPPAWEIEEVLMNETYTLTIEKEGYVTHVQTVIVVEDDVDVGTITLNEVTEPVYSLTAELVDEGTIDEVVELNWFTELQYIYYSDFEDDNGGWVPSATWGTPPVGDWEWTNTYNVSNFVPVEYESNTIPPPTAFSGTGLWGTEMYSNHSNSGGFSYLTQTFDFSGTEDNYLIFQSWKNTNGSFDYDQIRVNGDLVWGPEWHAASPYWEEVSIDLSAYDGLSAVTVVFEHYASTVVAYAGWYIDDVYIGPQESVPTRSRSFVQDTRAGLRNTYLDDRAFLDYWNVYRLEEGEEGDDGLWEFLGATAIGDSSYVDEDWLDIVEDGYYRWAVRGAYTGGLEADPTFSNVIPLLRYPVYTMTPDEFNFGQRLLDVATDPQTFTLTNEGGGTVEIEDIDITGTGLANFQLEILGGITLPHVLESLESMQFTVYFETATEGLKEADIEITETSTRTLHTIPIQGQGVVPEFLAPWNVAAVESEANYEMEITWDSPVLHHDDGAVPSGMRIGRWESLYVTRYDTDDLADFDGKELKNVVFYPRADYQTYTVLVWTGGSHEVVEEEDVYNEGLLIREQLVYNHVLWEWNYIELDIPVLIDAEEELWIGILAESSVDAVDNALFPLGADTGPANAGKGDLALVMIEEELVWVSVFDQYAINRNHSIQGFVVELVVRTRAAAPVALRQREYNISGRPEVDLFGIGNTRQITGYKVYRDTYVDPIATINNALTTEYLDTELLLGDYDYAVQAVYGPFESALTTPVTGTINGQAEPYIVLGVSALDFDHIIANVDKTVHLNISNQGGGTLNVGFHPLPATISAVPDTLSLTTGQAQDVAFTVNTDVLGAYSETIIVSSDDLDNPTLNVNATGFVTLTPISGLYLIDHAGGGNFQTFAEAVELLVQSGVDGPVTFEVTAGTYTEQVVIPEIMGASDVNTITFTGLSGVRQNPVIEFEATVNTERHVVKLEGAKNVRFENFTIEALATGTYGWPIHIMSNSQGIEIVNCDIITNDASTSSNYAGIVVSNSTTSLYTGVTGVQDILIEGNTVIGGYNGISVRGSSSLNTVDGLQVLNNQVIDTYYYGIYNYYTSAPEIMYNTVEIRSEGTTTTWGAGIYNYYVYDGMELAYNVVTNPGQYGIYSLYLYGAELTPNMIYNNMVGGGFRNTGTTAYGIYFGTQTNYVNVYYNSVNIDSGTGAAIYATTGLTEAKILNNSFAHTGTGNGRAAYYTGTASLLEHDHNNYFVGDSSLFVYYGSAVADLAALQAVDVPVGNDLNSHVGNPGYISATDLHVEGTQLWGRAAPLTGIVDDDIDGEARALDYPCIGADEYEIGDDDLAAVSISGPALAVVDADNEYTVRVQNFGANTQNNYTVQLLMVNSRTVLDELVIIDPLAVGEFADHVLTWTPTVEDSYEVYGKVILTGDEDPSNDETAVLAVTVVEPIVVSELSPYFEDFEYPERNFGWTSGAIAGVDHWELGTPAQTNINSALSGDNAWMTRLATNYDDNADTWLMSPLFDLTAASNPMFSVWLNIYGETGFDATELQYSLDGGASWIKVVGDPGFYNSTSASGPIAPPKWSGYIGTWVQYTTFLPVEVQNEAMVLFRFRFGSDVSGNSEGIAIDDVSIWEAVPMEYVSSTTTQDNTEPTVAGAVNTEIIGVQVVTAGTLTPLSVDSITFTTNGTTDVTDIVNAKLWFTGTSPVFAATTQVDTTYTDPDGVFVMNPDQELAEGTNYFWLTYDVAAEAEMGDHLDATCTQVVVDAIPYVPTVTDPAGYIMVGGPMFGTYTINHDGTGDYLNFSSALGALYMRGISAPVVFEVQPGTYTEQILFNGAIDGASAVNTVTFEGQAGVRQIPALQYQTDVSADRYVVRLTGASFIRFDNLKIEALAAGTYGWPIHIMSGSEDIEITNCEIITIDTSTSSNYNGIVISGSTTSYTSGASGVSNILIDNNVITGGYIGIAARGVGSADRVEGLQILNNDIVNPYYYGIYNYYTTAPEIMYNTIDVRSTGTTTTLGSGIYNYYVYDGMEQAYNVVTNPGQYGIYSMYLYGAVETPNMIYNNMVGGGFRNTGSTAYGIYFGTGTSYINLYYNSVNVDSGSGSALYATTGLTNLVSYNNSFAYDGPGNGRAMYLASRASVDEQDNNNYYAGGSTLFVYFGEDVADMAELQQWGTDVNSHAGNPMYVSATDLHAQGTQLWQRGVVIVGIGDDIDGDLRGDPPCIGADEYTPLSNDLAAVSITGPTTAVLENGTRTGVDYDIMILNAGALTQGTYTVQLLKVDSRTVLDQVEIVAVDLAAGDSVVHTLNWVPDTAGEFQLYGKVLLTGDENAANDETGTLTVNVVAPFDAYPFTENFDAVTAPEIPAGWTVENTNADTNFWRTVTTNPNSSPNAMYCNYNGSLAADDWFFTPPLYLTAGVDYDLSFMYRVYSSSYGEKLKVHVGTAPMSTAMDATPIFDQQNFFFTTYTEGTATFSVAESGSYYVGWHKYSDANKWGVYVDDIVIDMQVADLDPPANVMIDIVQNGTRETTVSLTWDPVVGANSYYIYSSDDPYAADWGVPVAQVGLEEYSEAVEGIKFYRVTASSDELPARVGSPTFQSTPARRNIRR